MRCKAPVVDPKWRAPEEKRTRRCLNSAVPDEDYCRTHLNKHQRDSDTYIPKRVAYEKEDWAKTSWDF